MLTPTRSVADAVEPCEALGPWHALPEKNESNTSAPTTNAIRVCRLARSVASSGIYCLFSGTSSTIEMQYPWGLTLVAFFTILIFIVTPKLMSWQRYAPAR